MARRCSGLRPAKKAASSGAKCAAAARADDLTIGIPADATSIIKTGSMTMEVPDLAKAVEAGKAASMGAHAAPGCTVDWSAHGSGRRPGGSAGAGDLAGDAGREVRAEERGGVADVFLGHVAAQRVHLRHVREHLAEPGNAGGGEGLDGTGRDRVHADAKRA